MLFNSVPYIFLFLSAVLLRASAAMGLRQLSLHVRRDNARAALAFYAKAGYAPRDDGQRGYLLLGRDIC